MKPECRCRHTTRNVYSYPTPAHADCPLLNTKSHELTCTIHMKAYISIAYVVVFRIEVVDLLRACVCLIVCRTKSDFSHFYISQECWCLIVALSIFVLLVGMEEIDLFHKIYFSVLWEIENDYQIEKKIKKSNNSRRKAVGSKWTNYRNIWHWMSACPRIQKCEEKRKKKDTNVSANIRGVLCHRTRFEKKTKFNKNL